MSYHTIIIVGNLGRDPEMRYTPNGNAVTTINVASNRTFNDSSGQRQKITTWFRVSVWGKQAESVNNYLQKGSQVLVEGELQPDKETGNPRTFTRNDGSTGTSYEVRARTVRFLTAKGTTSEDYQGDTGDGGDEEIPF
jgi:single-strand DNA-binding protein